MQVKIQFTKISLFVKSYLENTLENSVHYYWICDSQRKEEGLKCADKIALMI